MPVGRSLTEETYGIPWEWNGTNNKDNVKVLKMPKGRRGGGAEQSV